MSIVDLMSDDLKIDVHSIVDMAVHADSYYRKLLIGDRWFDVPKVQLKLIQRWIAEFVLAETDALPAYVTAYEPGSSVVKNARMHAQNSHLLHLDIAHFFPSCTSEMVADIFGSIQYATGYDTRTSLKESEVELLTLLSVREGRLTVGSPSSPFLANRIMLPIDKKILNALDEGYVYSRYSDDMTISSDEWIDAEGLTVVVEEIVGDYGFALNEHKAYCRGAGDRRVVTGIVITPDGHLSIGAKRKRQLEECLYTLFVKYPKFKDSISDDLIAAVAKHVIGLLSYYREVEPRYVAKILIKYSNYGLASTTRGGVFGALIELSGLE